jgi:hypothetical protein
VGDELDEPAALFFACALFSRVFGAASHELLPTVARNIVRVLGFRLDIDDIEHALLHALIAFGVVAFEIYAPPLRLRSNPSDSARKRPSPVTVKATHGACRSAKAAYLQHIFDLSPGSR